MKLKNLLPVMALMSLTACDNDDNSVINDDNNNGGNDKVEDTDYPAGSIVWKKDTTVILKDHFLVKADQSLYIEEGATIIASNNDVKPEIIVLGNLYSMGTKESPITFTVEESSKTDKFSRDWGGIICGFDSKEVYMNYTTIEYAGAITTENSLSFQYQLFKTESGEGVPAFHFCNPDGKFVITNSTFYNNAEDHIYITGGKSIVSNNKFITCGFDGGEAINYKAECLADIAYNLVYDANTNALKLSNGGFVNLQSILNCYNNTIVNTGWRRPKVKGGSIWLEKNIVANLYNNLVADCRWGLKEATEEPRDERSVITPNYYFASTDAGVTQMVANAKDGILNGENDILSSVAGDKDPMFKNFTQQSDININASNNENGAPAPFNKDWSFKLKSGSPALTGGNTNFKPHFSESALIFDGLKDIIENAIKSPAPASYFGAYGE